MAAPLPPSERFKIVVSDCHLSAGRHFEGNLNPHEDFHFDDEMVDLLEHFSTGAYGDGVEVEFFIAGDFFDFLNVPYLGEFDDAVTEEISLYKCEAIIKGHPKVMSAIRKFAGLPGKRVSYLIGNHDADLFFPKIRERITREWDPQGEFPSAKVKLIADTDRVDFGAGVEVHHGNQFEASNAISFESPLLSHFGEQPVLNLPWGSIYVMKIINRLRWEREHLDKIRPAKVFLFFGLILDPWFTLKFCFLSGYYFLLTRFPWSPRRRSTIRNTLGILKQETKIFQDLEAEARQLLTARTDLKTIIFGHTHRPMDRMYPDGRQYINTGTWVKMTYLDWHYIGQPFSRTFAWVRIRGDEARCELRQWVGEHNPHQLFRP